jgi:hypothetical protein
LFVRSKKLEEINMLKEYAVALVLSTATPVAADKQEGAKQAPESQKETVTQPEYIRPKTGGSNGGVGF